MTEADFWGEVKKRRRYFFLCWIGWIPFGAACIAVYGALFGNTENFPGTIALIAWFIFWSWLAVRLMSLICPQCNKRAIGHPLFFMRDAKCQHCGLSYTKKATQVAAHRR
jgi:hypothetical protein